MVIRERAARIQREEEEREKLEKLKQKEERKWCKQGFLMVQPDDTFSIITIDQPEDEDSDENMGGEESSRIGGDTVGARITLTCIPSVFALCVQPEVVELNDGQFLDTAPEVDAVTLSAEEEVAELVAEATAVAEANHSLENPNMELSETQAPPFGTITR